MPESPAKGHIKLARKAFASDPWWQAKRTFSKWEAWVDMIQLAQWAPRKFNTTKYGVISLERGELILSLSLMTKRWGWSTQACRTFVKSPEFSTRVKAGRETQAGTVYLIINYDRYQGTPEEINTPTNTPVNTPLTHLQHTSNTRTSSKAVKAVKQVKRIAAAGASDVTNLDAFPKLTMDAAHDRWVARIGAVEYSRFRKALLPVFQAKPLAYTGEQLADGVDAFYDGMQADNPAYRGKWTVQKFAGELHEWVRLGAMELVDDWGAPTERAAIAGIARHG
jgi:hypothetical protein